MPQDTPSACIDVRLQPRAKRNEIVGEREGVLIIRVTAPPVEGKANDALCRLIARQARVARGRVEIIRGSSSRDKVIRVEGLTRLELRSALGL